MSAFNTYDELVKHIEDNEEIESIDIVLTPLNPEDFKMNLTASGDGFWGCPAGPCEATLKQLRFSFIERYDFEEVGVPFGYIVVSHDKDIPYTDKGFESGLAKFLTEKMGKQFTLAGSERGQQSKGEWVGDLDTCAASLFNRRDLFEVEVSFSNEV